MINNKHLLKYVHPEVYNPTVIGILESLSKDFNVLPSISPQLAFTKKCMLSNTNADYKWMEKCSFNLVTKKDISSIYPDVEHVVYPDLKDFYEYLLNNAHEVDATILPKYAGMKYLGLDTETNTLNRNIRFVGGKLISEVYMVGLCIAITPDIGFYIPIKNNQLDNIDNYNWETEVFPFIQMVIDNFFQIWHNAQYDISVLRNNKIKTNNNFADTELLGKLVCKWEFEFPNQVHNALKANSAHYLKRPMVELHTLIGGKQNINFDRLAAVDSYLYGASDAMNTLGLFLMYTSKDFGVDKNYPKGRNPYLQQNFATKICMNTVRPTIAKTTMGLPIDYKGLKNNLFTILRRIILIECSFDENFRYGIINSDEKVGMYIGELLSEQWKGSVEQHCALLLQEFGMVSKVTPLKSGAEKRTYNCPDEVLKSLYKNIENQSFSYLSSEYKSKIRDVIDHITLYRSLQHEFGIYIGIMRNINFDDRGYAYVNYSLRQEGTDTGRYTNSKGTGFDQIHINMTPKLQKIKTTFYTGDGNAFALNSQGINRDKINMKPCRRIISMPRELDESLHAIDVKVRERFFHAIQTAKPGQNK